MERKRKTLTTKKTHLNTERKQTFGLTGKIEINEKTRQNAENKQTFSLTGKIEINEKTRQNAEIYKLLV